MRKGGRHQHLSTSSLSLVTIVASVLAGCTASAEGRIYGSEDACDVSSAIEGTYESAGARFEAASGKCVDLAAALERPADDQTFTLTKVDDDTFESASPVRASPKTFTLDADRCELVRTSTQTLATEDLDGKPVKVVLSAVTRVRRGAGRLDADQTIEVASETRGAKGFPCTITGHDAAVKR